MGIKKTFREKLAAGTLAASLLGVGGCDSNIRQNSVDLINIKNPNAVGASSITINWPSQLKSDPQEKTIDLTDVKQVAVAMDVKLDDPANPDPVLYKIKFINNTGDVGFNRELEIRVSNVKQGADIINSVEKHLISKEVQEIIRKNSAEQAAKGR